MECRRLGVPWGIRDNGATQKRLLVADTAVLQCPMPSVYTSCQIRYNCLQRITLAYVCKVAKHLIAKEKVVGSNPIFRSIPSAEVAEW